MVRQDAGGAWEDGVIRKGPLQYVKQVVRSGRVYEYFDCGKGLDGKRRYVRLPDRKDASFGGKYAALLGHRSRMAELDVAPEAMKLSKLIALYEQSQRYRKLARNSQDNYSLYLGKFCRALSDPVAQAVERKHVTSVLNLLIDKPGAANAMLRIVSALYQWARGNTEVTVEPCRDIEMQELGEHKPWPDELLADALTADNAQVRLAVSLLYYTAQRIGDVCKMTWGGLSAPDEHGRRFIHVVQEKTGKELWIQVHEALLTVLEAMPRHRTASIAEAKAERILGGDRGGYNTTTVRGWLQSFAKARGYKIVPHGLRKNAVIALLEAGCTVAEAASISGQSFPMVEKYARQIDQRRMGSAAILKLERKG